MKNPRALSHQLLSWKIILYMWGWCSVSWGRTMKSFIFTHLSLILLSIMILLPTFSASNCVYADLSHLIIWAYYMQFYSFICRKNACNLKLTILTISVCTIQWPLATVLVLGHRLLRAETTLLSAITNFLWWNSIKPIDKYDKCS